MYQYIGQIIPAIIQAIQGDKKEAEQGAEAARQSAIQASDQQLPPQIMPAAQGSSVSPATQGGGDDQKIGDVFDWYMQLKNKLDKAREAAANFRLGQAGGDNSWGSRIGPYEGP